MEFSLTPDQTLQIDDNLEDTDIQETIEQEAIQIPVIPMSTSTTPSATLSCETFTYGDNTTVGTRWEMWLERFNMYLTATGLTDEAKKEGMFFVSGWY